MLLATRSVTTARRRPTVNVMSRGSPILGHVSCGVYSAGGLVRMGPKHSPSVGGPTSRILLLHQSPSTLPSVFWSPHKDDTTPLQKTDRILRKDGLVVVWCAQMLQSSAH